MVHGELRVGFAVELEPFMPMQQELIAMKLAEWIGVEKGDENYCLVVQS